MIANEESTKEPQGLLFHYTSIQGLIGIFKDRKIWATSIYHLNDKEELFLARDLLRRGIEKLLKTIDTLPHYPIPPPNYREDLRIRFLSLMHELLDFNKEFPIFVCSFSEAGDQLSQWRGYCPNSCGFSIGFNYTELKEHVERQEFMLKKCIYDEKQQQSVIKQCIDEHIAPVLPTLIEKTYAEIAFNVLFEVARILPAIKSKYFEEEREWRLISSLIGSSEEQINFRQGKTAVIPYYEFELTKGGKELPIDRIIIGPTPNRDESYHSVVALLYKHNMSERTKVIHSAIPYREL